MEIIEPSFPLVSNEKGTPSNFINIENPIDMNLQSTAEIESETHDLAQYVSDIKQLLSSSSTEVKGGPSDDARLQYAIRRYRKACELFPDSYDLKFIGHKIAIKEGDMSQAIMYFDELRRLFPDHEPLKEYLMEITESVRHQTTDDNFMFFLKLPFGTQKEILIHSAVRHEMSDKLMDACQLYVLLLKAYPDTALHFGVHAAQLAIRCEDQNYSVSEHNVQRKLFVEDILFVILRNKIIVHETCIPPDIQVYNPQDYLSVPYATSSKQVKYPTNVNVTYGQLKSWLERAQGYYIASRDWRKLFEISLTVMESTGYLVFPSSPRISIADFFEDPSQLPVKLFNLLNQKPVTLVNQTSSTKEMILHPLCISIGIACFVYCCHEFYNVVSGSKHTLPPENKGNCIVPIWIGGINAEYSSPSSPTITPNSSHLSHDPRASKKRRISFLLASDSGRDHVAMGGDEGSENSIVYRENRRGRNVMNVRNLLINDDETEETEDSRFKEWQESLSSEPTVRDAILYLERASSCWDDLKSMVKRGGNEPEFLDQEFERLLDAWNLPLDISNAVMLTRADSELTSGNIRTAYIFYEKIISRISVAWGSHRRKESQKEQHSTSSHLLTQQNNQQLFNDNTSDPASTSESTIKEQSPLILTFRVLYSISTLYRAIGWWAQARAELCMILATISITPVDKSHSERDDWHMTKVQRDVTYSKSCKLQGFKLIEVTKEGLVVRTIKELMTCFENELNSAQSSLLDQTIGNIIVLMQFCWPYWRNQLRHVLFPIIESRGGLKYPDMLRFLYEVEILREMLEFYRKTPNIELSFCLNNSLPASTSESIQALENRISNPSEFNSNKSLVDFFRERLKDEPLDTNTNVERETSLRRGNIKTFDHITTSDAQETPKSWKMDVSSIVAVNRCEKRRKQNKNSGSRAEDGEIIEDKSILNGCDDFLDSS